MQPPIEMVKTNAQKQAARDERLAKLPTSARHAKAAVIKKKEGRVLDSAEKHALAMRGDMGKILHAWEILRTNAERLEEKVLFVKKQADADSPAAAEALKIATGERSTAVTNLIKLLEPNFAAQARTPKVSRVIQSCIKHGSEEQHDKILALINKDLVGLATDSFGHYIVLSVLRHGNHATFRKAATAVIASSTKLVPSKFGLEVVNAVYAHKLTTALERNLLTLSILRDNIAVMKSWRGYPVLEDMLRLETTHAKRLSAALFKVADKFTSQKDVAHLPFVQRLLCALFTVGVEDEVQEVAATLSQNITPLVASREGALLVAKLFTVGAVTKRRDVLRQVAAAFEDIVLTKQGAPMFAHMLDMVYDAQISAKFISGPIVAALPAVLSSPYAHLVILHLLTPDLGRKEKALLPGWLDEFNLYSRENSGWNKHTWHRADGEEAGTVEVCTQPAEKSHAIALKVLLPAIAEFVKKTEDMAGAKLGVTRIAKELHHLIDSKDPLLEHVELDAETVRILLAQVPKKVAKGDAAEELIATAVAAVELIPKVAGVRRPRSVSAAPRKEAAPKASDDAAPKEASARRAIPEKTTAAVTARKPDAKKKPTVTTFETDE